MARKQKKVSLKPIVAEIRKARKELKKGLSEGVPSKRLKKEINLRIKMLGCIEDLICPLCVPDYNIIFAISDIDG